MRPAGTADQGDPAGEAAVRPDPWLSDLLGRPAYTVAAEAVHSPATVRRVREFVADGAFLQSRIDVADTAGAAVLETLGFRLVDTNVLFEGQAPRGPEPGADVRLARPGDRDAVRALAGRGFERSRFHLDGRIPAGTADRIKAEWAANFFAGRRGDAMVVADGPDGVGGFLQLLDDGRGASAIDLIAVDAPLRGRGLARAMIAFAARRPGIVRMRVGTQIANRASIRLYESLGLRFAEARYVFHALDP